MTGSAEVPIFDLTDRATENKPGSSVGTLTEEPYDPSPQREWTRGFITITILVIIGIIIDLFLLGLFFKWLQVDDVIKLSAALLSPIIGLFGAVMGFYFGEKQGQQGRG